MVEVVAHDGGGLVEQLGYLLVGLALEDFGEEFGVVAAAGFYKKLLGGGALRFAHPLVSWRGRRGLRNAAHIVLVVTHVWRCPGSRRRWARGSSCVGSLRYVVGLGTTLSRLNDRNGSVSCVFLSVRNGVVEFAEGVGRNRAVYLRRRQRASQGGYCSTGTDMASKHPPG